MSQTSDPKSTPLAERSTAAQKYGAFQPSQFSPHGEVVLVAWNSTEGIARLKHASHAEAFFRLAHFFQAQTNPLYCGVATAVMILNALRHPLDKAAAQPTLEVKIPEATESIPFATFVQSTFLGGATEKVKARAVVEYREKNREGTYRPGLGLMELKGLFEAYGAKATGEFAEATTPEKFRALLKIHLSVSQDFVLVHFRCDLIGGLPRGHISPLGAYDDKTDSVLVLDVAAHKGPWYWVPVPQLFQAMRATYDTQPKGGGYLVVSDD